MRAVLVIFLMVLFWAGAAFADDKAKVSAVLDMLHEAASDADYDRYFGLFAENAVFIGTDISERWPIKVFQAYAKARFDAGGGWTYTMQERHIDFSANGDVAWFDENLWTDTYGTSRGTGVLEKTTDGWKIAQYHLTYPIPNDLAADMTARIKDFEGH